MMVAMRPIMLAAVAAVCAIAATAAAADVVHFRVEDTIQPASQRFIERALAEAEQRGAALVVMELDTPGGLLETLADFDTAAGNGPAAFSRRLASLDQQNALVVKDDCSDRHPWPIRISIPTRRPHDFRRIGVMAAPRRHLNPKRPAARLMLPSC